MNETRFVDVTARNLMSGDVIVGSGFKVRTAEFLNGRMEVVGNYPLSPIRVRTFSPTHLLTVRRNDV